MLEDLGWQVIGPAATVAEALRLIEDEPPSLAILDVNLEHELVKPVAVELRDRNIPFVIASAYHRPEFFGGQPLAGIPNVRKPIEERRLIAVLEEIMPGRE